MMWVPLLGLFAAFEEESIKGFFAGVWQTGWLILTMWLII